MGYTTNFRGAFSFSRPLSKTELDFLTKFNGTRRMKRDVKKLTEVFGPGEYGTEGEYFVAGSGFAGQDYDATIIDYNQPPMTQPGLWCQWTPNEDGTQLEWDGGEKFYNYVEWLQYLIENFFKPWGVQLNGEVEWRGEDWDDTGRISVSYNRVKARNN